MPLGPPIPDRGLAGRRLVLLGGTAGIGLATAREALRMGAAVTVVGRGAEGAERVRAELGEAVVARFDASDEDALRGFFAGAGAVDHVLVTSGGPHYAPLPDLDVAAARRAVDERVRTMLFVARHAGPRLAEGGSVTFMGTTGARRPAPGLAVTGAMSAAAESLVRGLAVELAPVRVNLLAAGFVDTGLSARLLGDGLAARREDLRRRLPIRRVVQPEDVARLALHVMTNPAITGATLDIDGGESLV